MKTLKLSALLILTLVLAACPKTPYGKAVKAGLDVTDTIHTGADSLDKLRLNGTISVEDERAAQNYLDAINKLDVDVYGPCVQAAHLAGDKSQGFVACAQSMVKSVGDPNLLASFHVTNPQSQQTVALTGQAVVNLVQAVINAIGAAK